MKLAYQPTSAKADTSKAGAVKRQRNASDARAEQAAHAARQFSIAPHATLHTRGSQVLQRKCACGSGNTTLDDNCSACRTRNIQAKFTIDAGVDPLEQEADRVADQVLARPAILAKIGAPPRIQRYSRETKTTPETAPSSVEHVLASPGQPLELALQSDMERRFGLPFSHVRIHTGASAAKSAREISALAYTSGHNIVFGYGQFAPETNKGRHLLAHELTHVAQQQGHVAAPGFIQRFRIPRGTAPDDQIDETGKIAPSFDDLMTTIKTIIDASTLPRAPNEPIQIDMDEFVLNSGGRPVGDRIKPILQPALKGFSDLAQAAKVPTMLNYRYLFTCRCGLIDMRHFFQIMYISHFAREKMLTDGNAFATKMGRDHEVEYEAGSRFAPEDTPSNALGAFTGGSCKTSVTDGNLLGSASGGWEWAPISGMI